MADPEHFDADPDPDSIFKANADPNPDPDPNPFTRVRKKISSNLQLLFPKSSKTCHSNFLSKNAGGRPEG